MKRNGRYVKAQNKLKMKRAQQKERNWSKACTG